MAFPDTSFSTPRYGSSGSTLEGRSALLSPQARAGRETNVPTVHSSCFNNFSKFGVRVGITKPEP